jgi:hypothetical protein
MIIVINCRSCSVMVIRLDIEIWEIGKSGNKREGGKRGGQVGEEV